MGLSACHPEGGPPQGQGQAVFHYSSSHRRYARFFRCCTTYAPL